MRNEWVPFKRYKEMCENWGSGVLPLSSRGPPLSAGDYAIDLPTYGGDGPPIRYRVERRVPRRDPHDWSAFEFNLEDIENWMAWAAAELVRTPLPAQGMKNA